MSRQRRRHQDARAQRWDVLGRLPSREGAVLPVGETSRRSEIAEEKQDSNVGGKRMFLQALQPRRRKGRSNNTGGDSSSAVSAAAGERESCGFTRPREEVVEGLRPRVHCNSGSRVARKSGVREAVGTRTCSAVVSLREGWPSRSAPPPLFPLAAVFCFGRLFTGGAKCGEDYELDSSARRKGMRPRMNARM
ncbi:hypothetical protein MTO96_006693 [Rhipicephalus appendiculatus]